MNKTEYIAAIEADLTAANALCVELRTLRNFKKIAQGLTDADKMVSFDVLNKTITDKESELQKLRAALGKNRRIVKKLDEIEAIETGKATTPKAKKAKVEKAVSDATTQKPAEKKPRTKATTKKQTGKPEAKAEQTASGVEVKENPAA